MHRVPERLLSAVVFPLCRLTALVAGNISA
jgi:hypothetical protein